MSKHTEKCIQFYESLEAFYANKAREEDALHKENIMESDHFTESRIARAMADAYHTCAAALKDPMYFTRDSISS